MPLIIKPAAGGGGKGMRIVRDVAQIPEALAAARRLAESGFGDGSLLLERFLPAPRHVEVQIFADSHGNFVHLGDPGLLDSTPASEADRGGTRASAAR
jgi:acetyl/propionyl-CoA carboxylase alpha subunit